METKTKEQRVKAEKLRLGRLYKEMPDSKKKLCAGLIERAAFIRIELEDLETFLSVNGWAEPFSQSEKLEPYDRARPQGQTYNTLHGNYLKTIKQLNDMLPEEVAKPIPIENGFDNLMKRSAQL